MTKWNESKSHHTVSLCPGAVFNGHRRKVTTSQDEWLNKISLFQSLFEEPFQVNNFCDSRDFYKLIRRMNDKFIYTCIKIKDAESTNFYQFRFWSILRECGFFS